LELQYAEFTAPLCVVSEGEDEDVLCLLCHTILFFPQKFFLTPSASNYGPAKLPSP
jgi:hypothetical protein